MNSPVSPGPVNEHSNVSAGSEANVKVGDVLVVSPDGPPVISVGACADCSYAPASHGWPRSKPRWSTKKQSETMSTAGLLAGIVRTSLSPPAFVSVEESSGSAFVLLV